MRLNMDMKSVKLISAVVCVLLCWFNYCRADGHVSLEDQFRFSVAELTKEIARNRTIFPCRGDTGMCNKVGKCINELQQEGDAGETMCSIIMYRTSDASALRFESKNKRLPEDPSILKANKNYHNLFDKEPRERTEDLQLTRDQHNKSPADLVFHEMPEIPSTSEHPSPAEVWGFGVLSVAIISLSGLFGAVFWPLMKTDIYAQMMWVLIGLAVGSLTASSTFQLIPEGFKLKEHDENYLTTALFMWVSFWALYMFEALAKIFLHSEPESSFSGGAKIPKVQIHSASSADQPREQLELDGLLPNSAMGNGNGHSCSNLEEAKNIPLYMSQGSLHNLTLQKTTHMHSHGTESDSLNKKIAPVAWMIILGDGIHNFIDGMSIGAGFSNSIAVGTSISIAIACEEFPHELGDFAILINSGMSVKRALLFNFLSACTAFAGLVLGILLGEIDASVYIFAFAGGLFLYIALTDLMPELNEMIATGLKKSKKYALFVLLLQNVGIFLGASILYTVTYFQ